MPNDYNQSLSKDPVLCKRLLTCLREFKFDFGKDNFYVTEHPDFCKYPEEGEHCKLVFMASYLRTGQIIKQIFP